MSKFRAAAVHKVGLHRGACRIWLQGKKPAAGGFLPQVRFNPIKDEAKRKLILKVDAHGSRMVSRKATAKEDVFIPVIDLNQADILEMFEGLEHVRVIYRDGEITIQALESEMRARERMERLREKVATGSPITIGSLCHGGGILTKAIHDGLAQGGIVSTLSFVNEIRDELLEHSANVNPVWNENTVALSMPLQELAFDKEAMDLLASCELLEAGLPCEMASVAGRSKNKTVCAEEHPHVGHLVASFIAIIAKVNPSVILLENVPGYKNVASMHILRNQLRDFGYEVHETIVNSTEWGNIESRRRFAMVAVTVGMEFNISDLIPPHAGAPMLSDILDDVPLDSPSWKTMDYLVEKAARDKAAGKGFGLNVVTEDATKVGTLGKGYSKARQSEAKLVHPENPALMRLFTPREHAALKGIDSQLISGLSNTVAHELLGQSVTPVPFQAIGKLVAASIHKVIQAGNKVFKLVKQVEASVKLSNQFVDEAKRFTLHQAQASLF